MDKHYSKFLQLHFLHNFLNIRFQTNVYLILYRGNDIQDVMKFIDRAFNKLMVNISIKSLLKYFEILFQENENGDIQQILIKKSNYMKQFFRAITTYIFVFSLSCAMTPFAAKKLLLPSYFPGLDESIYEYNTPYFWIFYIMQTIIVSFELFVLKFYICLIVNFTFFGTTMMQILNYKIKSLGTCSQPTNKINGKKMVKLETKKDLNKEILTCIKMHLEIIKYVNFNARKHQSNIGLVFKSLNFF